jgi:hypothetical protein
VHCVYLYAAYAGSRSRPTVRDVVLRFLSPIRYPLSPSLLMEVTRVARDFRYPVRVVLYRLRDDVSDVVLAL